MIAKRRCAIGVKSTRKNHLCFIKPIMSRTKSDNPVLFFFDFETKTVDGEMIPFYCVVQKVCVKCDQKEFVTLTESSKKTDDVKFADGCVERADCCGYRQYVFENNSESVVDDLIDFIFEQPNSVWIAHNGSRFDAVFLLRNVLIKKNLVPPVVMNGNKVMMMEIPFINVKFLDSYLFLDMKLADFPASLGFDDFTKGYHPYFFTDLNYSGRMVDVK